MLTIDKIVNHLHKTQKALSLYQLIELAGDTKKPRNGQKRLVLIYYLNTQAVKLGQPVKVTYEAYEKWILKNELDDALAGPNLFTRGLASRHVYPAYTKIDNKTERVYKKLSYCPTCKRSLT